MLVSTHSAVGVPTLKDVSIPHRDLCWFQPNTLRQMKYGNKVSIPHRDLCWFQQLASETFMIFGFQGTFPTHTSNGSSLESKKQVEIAETLTLSSPTLP